MHPLQGSTIVVVTVVVLVMVVVGAHCTGQVAQGERNIRISSND
jgi:hypothetical protein